MARIVTGAYMRGFVIPRRRKHADEESPSLCRAFVILSGAMRSVAPVGTSIARPGIDAKAPRKKAKRNPRFRLRTFPITLPLPSGSFNSGFAFAQDDNVCVYVLSFRAQRGIPLPLQPSAFGVGSLGLRPRDDRCGCVRLWDPSAAAPLQDDRNADGQK